MGAERTPARELGEGYTYVALGCTFAGGVVVFVVVGVLVDRWLGLTPLFTLTGTLVGAVLSFLHVYWKLRAEDEARRRKREREG